ncbi:class I SAM-dependent methyltransferase [Nonomuraea sp. NPDC049129]|uniref:class I SAM-dependent methyltransferase n=1 Tax=Nonomuraea sp. NPDC049129 TaxID=3155272 RepID=UPI0033FEF5DE
MEFIDDNLPPAPARILDAGCGNGELADRLRRAGHHVTAIDIDPALEGPSICVADICTYQDDPFDVVVFSLSLHHVHSLEMALDRAAALLKPGGTLLVDEFAYERADAAIADTYFGVAGSLARWREHHRDLHTGATMIDAITRRFNVDTLSRVPYLHRYLENNALYDSESVLGFQLIATSKESVMPVIRTTRYTATVDLAELLTRRAALINRIRADHPELTETRLTRLQDGTYQDIWHWSSIQDLENVMAIAPSWPEAGAAFAVTTDATAETAEIIDER